MLGEFPLKPFGLERQEDIPVDQTSIDALSLVDSLRVPIETRASIILGRKGSGKSTVIAGLEGRRFLQKRLASIGSLYNGDVVIAVRVWSHFHEMIKEVVSSFGASVILLDEKLVQPEILQERWEFIFWEEILRQFWQTHASDNAHFTRTDVGRAAAKALTKYYNPPYEADASRIAVASKMIEESARQAVLTLMRESHQGCLLLFDNMEEYPVRNPLFRKVIGGFLRAVNSFPGKVPGVRVVFCLPEEIEEFVRNDASSTVLKDFAGQYRIRWKPIDLLRAAAHRYRGFIASSDDQEFSRELQAFRLHDEHGRTDRKQVVAFLIDCSPASA